MVDRLELLLQIGRPGGPTLREALALFAAVRSTPDEGRAIRRLLARHAAVRLPEALLIAVASALADRGERAAAAEALAGAASMPALMLHADLLDREGDRIGALALVERVLLTDIDWPGARERRRRWTAPDPSPRGFGGAGAELWAAPSRAGPFRRIREVARGGTGVVYEAEDRELGRRVGLKVYHRPDRHRAQLLHEARVAVTLEGEGVVPIFDVHADEGWLAMAWAPCGTLRDAVRERDARSNAVEWAHPLARALARAHAAGWVHHDLKPGNVLLRSRSEPLLADFGSARRAGEPSAPGSFGYVSPERLAGRACDPRDDIYGFGRILEDALDSATDAEGPARHVARACVGPDEGRPRDGFELIRLLAASGVVRV